MRCRGATLRRRWYSPGGIGLFCTRQGRANQVSGKGCGTAIKNEQITSITEAESAMIVGAMFRRLIGILVNLAYWLPWLPLIVEYEPGVSCNAEEVRAVRLTLCQVNSAADSAATVHWLQTIRGKRISHSAYLRDNWTSRDKPACRWVYAPCNLRHEIFSDFGELSLGKQGTYKLNIKTSERVSE